MMDPITLEVLWNRLVAVVNEQAAALVRTSFSSIVREAGDLSAGIFDRRGRMIAQAVTGTPGHINSMATYIHHFLAVYPPDKLDPGDVLITNNPWQTSGHLNDLTVITPVFRGNDLIGFFGNTCHAIDIGGRILSAEAREVFEEGLHIPISKLYVAGQPNEDLIKIVRGNVRAPDQVVGDMRAQVAANDVGSRRLLDFLEEFGLEDIEDVADEVVGRSESAMRAAIAAIPDCSCDNEVWSDGFEEPVHVKVRVDIHGDELTVDFAGSSPQSSRGINVVMNYTHAYTTYAVKCAISPEVPNNEGSFRPVKVVAPLGSILNAQYPAPVAARHILGHFLPGAVFGALAKIIPDRVMAEGSAGLWGIHMQGHDMHDRPFVYVFFLGGGTGARPASDGLSATAFPSGVSGTPVEVIESLSPVVVGRKELREDSGGPGKFRGGLGQTMSLRMRTKRPWVVSAISDRLLFPASGYAGGKSGAKGDIVLHTGDHSKPK